MIEPGTLAAQAAKALAQQVARGASGRRERRVLRQGKDAPALRSALVAIVQDGVKDAAEALSDHKEEQESFRHSLFERDQSAWPLVNGTSPGDLVAEVREWVAPLLAPPDEDGRVPAVRADHPYVEAVSVAIMGRLQHWGERGGGAVAPMWQAFLVETGTAEVFDHGRFPAALEELREESLFDILHFKYRVVPYVDEGLHGAFAAAAVDWVRRGEDVPGVSVGVITGAAGTGKSRLAAEICDLLAEAAPQWHAGFADYTALAASGMPERPLLLVCDYPERHPERVGDFLARLWRYRREDRLEVPVRVLLVSRHTQTWREPIRAKVKNLDRLIEHRIELEPERFDADELALHAARAYTAFCDGFGIPAVWREAFSVGPDIDRPILVHIAALLAAHGIAHGSPADADRGWSPATEAEALLDDLVGAEIDRLMRLRLGESGPAVFTSPTQVREALCLTTLTSPARCDLPELLACTEAFGPHGFGDRVAVAELLLDAFPAPAGQIADRSLRSVAPVEPDLVAAHLLWRTPGRSELVKRLVTSTTVAERPAYHAQLVGMLALAAEDYPDIGVDLKAHLASSLSALIGAGEASAAGLTELLSERLSGLVDAAVAAATDQDLTAARELATALRLPALAGHHGIDEAAAVAIDRLPYPHPGLTGLGSALSDRAVIHQEREQAPGDLARAYNRHGLWLGDDGQRVKA